MLASDVNTLLFEQEQWLSLKNVLTYERYLKIKK